MNQENTYPLFYFSGTGGCLATTRDIAKALPEYEPLPIVSIRDGYHITTDVVGFVFPNYFSGLPRIAAEFVNNLTFNKPCYIFAIIPCGHPISGYALKQIDSILKNKGQRLTCGFYLKMHDSYLPMFNVPSKDRLVKIYSRCEKKLQSVVSHIRARNNFVAPSLGGIPYLRYPNVLKSLSRMDEDFKADDRCNNCGQCQKVCPVNNIVISESKPVWQHNCEFCLACIHFCPQQAIQWKNVTQKKGRYHFKGITASDISQQKQSRHLV